MNIALFDSESAFGGIQRSLLDVARGLVMRHWRVVAYLTASGPMQRALEREGIPTYLLPPAIAGRRWQSRSWLLQQCRRDKIDLLYANSTPAALLGCGVMRVLRGKLCWRVHSENDLRAPLWKIRLCARLATAIFPTSDTLHARLCRIVGSRTQITMIPRLIDLSGCPVSAPSGLPRHKHPVIGMVGAWAPQNGQELLVKAFRLLKEGGCPAHLYLASIRHHPNDERYRTMVQGMIKAGGLADRVFLDGDITDLPAFLGRCDVIVAPFLHPTSGRIALEAAAYSRPIIATWESGIGEIIEDGHTGLLVPGNAPNTLADSLALLLASPALCTEMGRQARIRAEERYSLTILLDALEALLPEAQRHAWTI